MVITNCVIGFLVSDAVNKLVESLSHATTQHERNLSVLLNMVRHERIFTDNALANLLNYAGTSTLKEHQQKLRKYMKRFDYSDSSVASYSSRLKKLVAYYQDHCLSDELPTQLSIGEKLGHLARKELGHCSQKAQLEHLHSLSGIPLPSLKRWLTKGTKPTKAHQDALFKLADHFDVSRNYLTIDPVAMASPATTRIAKDSVKALPKVIWGGHLQGQLDKLLLFKTKARTPALSLASFKLNRREAQTLVGGARWTTNADGSNASGQNFERMLDRYFRWLCSNYGLEAEQLDLSMLLVAEYLEAYVDDCLDGEFYATLQTTLNLLSGLIDPFQGYLCRYHAPLTGYPLGDGQESEYFDQLSIWQEHASYINSQVKTWLRDVRHLMAEQQHDSDDAGKRNIGWLLDSLDSTLDQSVADVRQLSADLSQHSKRLTGINRLAPAQVSLWLLMSLEAPLRVSNWCALKFSDKDRSKEPILFRDSGRWRLRVPRSYLKNRRGREVEAIDQVLSNPLIGELIEQVLNYRKEHKIETDAVFVQTRSSKHRSAGEAYQRTALAKSIQTWTGRAAFTRWPDRDVGRGINPHGMRHFVASYVLDKTGDYRLAATSLMDSVAVVMNVYGKNDHSLNQKKLAELHRV